MLHDQMITFLETTVIFLLLTNAVSGFAAAYAISLATSGERKRKGGQVAAGQAVFSAMWPRASRDLG